MPKAKSSSASKALSTNQVASPTSSKSLRSQQTASKHGKETQKLVLPIKKSSKTIQKTSKQSGTPSNSQGSSAAPSSQSSKNASKNKPKNAEKVLALLASKNKNKKSNSSQKKTEEKESKSIIQPPQSAFELFSSKIWGMYQDDEKFQSCTKQEKREIVKKSWSKLTKEKKQKYEQKAKDDDKRYEKECKSQKKKRVSVSSQSQSQSESQENSSMEQEDEPPSQSTKKQARENEPYTGQNQNVKKVKNVLSKYNAFCKIKSPEIKKENPDLTFGQLASKIGEQYKNLTEDDEDQIEKIIEEDRKRYEREIKDQSKSPTISISKSKSPQVELKSQVVMPKQVTTSFFVFLNKNRLRIKEENPDMSVCDLGKAAGQEWKTLTDTDKKQYDIFIEEDRKRYQKEMKQLQTQGYFTNADGVKSTDMKVKNRGSRTRQVGVRQEGVRQLREEGVVHVPRELRDHYKEGTMLPKGIRSPFFYFSAQCWIDVKKTRVEGELFNYIKITKENAEKWKSLTDEDKEKFQVLYEADKKRRLDQFDQIKKKGFFMTEEGEKSTDLPVKKPKIKMVKKIEEAQD